MLNNKDLMWVNNSCDWRGNSGIESVIACRDFLEGLPGTFRVGRCTKCGIYRQYPQLAWDSLKHYYPIQYKPHSSLIMDESSFIKRKIKGHGNWKRMRLINKYKQEGGNLLDVGCGTGLFLEEVLRSKNQWNAIGIEPSLYAANYAKQKLGIPIFNEKLSNVSLPESYFDVVTMWNVLEHLDHPIQDLTRVRASLKTDGLLVISTPNPESLSRYIFGKYWVGWDQPRHLYIFPIRLLKSILSDLQFRVIASSCISTSYATLGHSLDFWSQNWTFRSKLPRHIILKFYSNYLPILPEF